MYTFFQTRKTLSNSDAKAGTTTVVARVTKQKGRKNKIPASIFRPAAKSVEVRSHPHRKMEEEEAGSRVEGNSRRN